MSAGHEEVDASFALLSLAALIFRIKTRPCSPPEIITMRSITTLWDYFFKTNFLSQIPALDICKPCNLRTYLKKSRLSFQYFVAINSAMPASAMTVRLLAWVIQSATSPAWIAAMLSVAPGRARTQTRKSGRTIPANNSRWADRLRDLGSSPVAGSQHRRLQPGPPRGSDHLTYQHRCHSREQSDRKSGERVLTLGYGNAGDHTGTKGSNGQLGEEFAAGTGGRGHGALQQVR